MEMAHFGIHLSDLRTTVMLTYSDVDLGRGIPLEAMRDGGNADLTRIRQADAEDEGIREHVDAAPTLRDRSGGRNGRARCHPHSGHAPSPYPPLRAGWAFAPGHSGETEEQTPKERPSGAFDEKDQDQ